MSILVGKNENQTFNIYNGVGRNGKSALVSLMYKILGDYTGWGDELANIIIFVFLQPSLILLFFCLWIRAKIKNGRYSKTRQRKPRKFINNFIK